MTNVLLYWNDVKPPDSVSTVAGYWRDAASAFDVNLLNWEQSRDFLRDAFGEQTAKIFASCKIPAMQSDFLRVHWILKNGGVYSDLTFAPQNNPKFWAEDDQLVCVKWHHGLIVNGIFYAKPEAELLLRIAERIQFNVKNQIGNNILQVTGPGVWREVLSNETDKRFSLIKKSDLFAKFIRHSHYSFSTRNTQNHWSEMQKTESIYRDVKNG